jgi:hypothetical protein
LTIDKASSTPRSRTAPNQTIESMPIRFTEPSLWRPSTHRWLPPVSRRRRLPPPHPYSSHHWFAGSPAALPLLSLRGAQMEKCPTGSISSMKRRRQAMEAPGSTEDLAAAVEQLSIGGRLPGSRVPAPPLLQCSSWNNETSVCSLLVSAAVLQL